MQTLIAILAKAEIGCLCWKFLIKIGNCFLILLLIANFLKARYINLLEFNLIFITLNIFITFDYCQFIPPKLVEKDANFSTRSIYKVSQPYSNYCWLWIWSNNRQIRLQLTKLTTQVLLALVAIVISADLKKQLALKNQYLDAHN